MLAGCGGGSGDDETTATDDRGAIIAVLGELRDVQDSGDAATACREVYVIQEPPRPGGAEGGADAGADGEAAAEGDPGEEGGSDMAGGDCESKFLDASARRQEQVSDLKTEVGEIEVDGDSATAILHTEVQRTDGSFLTQDVPYDLVRTPEGWRVRISAEG